MRLFLSVLALLLAATLPASAAAIELRLEVRSEVRGHAVASAPRILVLDDHEATITIEGGDTALNGSPVPSTKRPPSDYVARVTVRPRLLGNKVLRVHLAVYLSHGKQVLRRTFDLTAVEGHPSVLDFEDADRQEKMRVSVTALIRE